MADRKWSPGETAALIDAWRPLYNRRRSGESDAWVPAHQRTRARSTGDLATEDWRAVATAVNSFRTETKLPPIRKHEHCKRRVERLKKKFGEQQLATPSWYGFLRLVHCIDDTAVGRRHSSLRVLATPAAKAHDGDECGGGAVGGHAPGGSVVAEGGSAAAEVNGGGVVMMGAGGAGMENASDGVAAEGGTAKPPPPSGPAARFDVGMTDFLGAIPKKRRTGASSSTSAAGAGDGRAPSVKEELVREMNARRAGEDEGRAPAAGFAATAREMAAALAEAESKDVAVVANLSEMFKEATKMYKELTMERIKLRRKILAASVGGAAVPEPDAARA